MAVTKMIYSLQDEFVEEKALQMLADKQGSQIIEAITLKVLQPTICHSAPTENLLLPYVYSAHFLTEHNLW